MKHSEHVNDSPGSEQEKNQFERERERQATKMKKIVSNKMAILGILVMLSSPLCSLAATHIVGDSQGWGFSVPYDSWASGNTFAAGDTLVFNYQSGAHNVVPVNMAGYRNCMATGKRVAAASSGNDKFTLKKGANYFICSLPGHCSAGMKILVNAQ